MTDKRDRNKQFEIVEGLFTWYDDIMNHYEASFWVHYHILDRIINIWIEEVKNMLNGETMYYSEFVEIAPVFFPKPEGIFIRYPNLIPAPWIVPNDPECIDMIREYTIKAIEVIRELQNHPIKAEISVKLIKPCMAMGMVEETKELYSYATKTGKSDDALASWARILLEDVRNAFGDQLEAH